jgi:UDP-3-O-acyl-N-acetylglucosamine deacetylase
MGDLALLGRPVLARFEAYKAGHTLHNRLVRQLVDSPRFSRVLAIPSVGPTLFSIPERVANLGSIPLPL